MSAIKFQQIMGTKMGNAKEKNSISNFRDFSGATNSRPIAI